MCFFGKKKISDKVKEDRELIETNSKAIEILIVLAKTNNELIISLKEVQEKLKYLVPSHDSSIVDYDRAIKNKIDDLRIALSKIDNTDSQVVISKTNNIENTRVTNLIVDINCIIASRNVML